MFSHVINVLGVCGHVRVLSHAVHGMPWTRWVESKSVADRAVLVWPNIRKLVLFWEKLPKSKQPKCKSFLFLQNAVHDPLTIAKFEFFSYVAGLLQPF